jgi:AcrR family transcriptional regulator
VPTSRKPRTGGATEPGGAVAGRPAAVRRAQRDSYHHGDLTNALTEAGVQLARTGGPGAVVLREAARKVGVSATAAYRHFANHGDLMYALKQRCQAILADWMRRELAAGAPVDDPAEDALRQLSAIGLGYVRFALAEPGLFRTAFCHTEPSRLAASAEGSTSAEPAGNEPDELPDLDSFPSYRLLTQILDRLVELGRIPAHRRPYAPMHAWSSAHGLALLLLDGPLAALPETERDRAIQATLQLVIDGLTAP